ncbi:hypothetical protein [Vibrio rhodolitus]|nr:hypothetical protein [Vibrio rhodolitus]
MKGKNLVALGVVLALSGCGSDDGGSNSSDNNGGGNGGGVTNPPSTSLIQHWPLSKVRSEIANVATTTGTSMMLCDRNQEYIETDHFMVGFADDSTRFDKNELIQSAKITQAGFNELIAHSKLNPSSDLNITSGSKWVACYNDAKKGTGTGYANLFVFSPSTLDVNHSDFADSYILAKHELFHVFQYEKLNDSAQFFEMPRWFMEGSAEFFAGRPLKNTTHKMDDFISDTSLTPMGIETWQDEVDLMQDSAIHTAYFNDMYDMYQNNVLFYVNSGMSFEQMFTVMENSIGYNFVNAMANLERELDIKTAYTDLKDDSTLYRNNVIAQLNAKEISGSYIDDVNLDVDQVLLMRKGTEDAVAKGSISRDQSKYAFLPNVPDGEYDGYVVAPVSADVDRIYGSILVTVKDGKIGNLDFTGVQELID